jgi:N utilization substance protein A
MSNKIQLVVESVSNEKDIPKEVVFEALEVALETATKKKYGLEKEFKVTIDRATGEYATVRRWLVVTDTSQGLENPHAEMSYSAAKELDPKVENGGFIEEPVESIEFGRIAAQTAKQVIMQRLRMAKREQVIRDYEARIGELLIGQVKKVTRDYVIVDLGNNIEAILRRNSMLPRETMRVSDRVRAYLEGTQKDQRGPQLTLSRTAPQMLIELFKIEVPEIGDGLIELKGAARDPGARAKISVLAKDNRIDPVGACVGMRGSRVQAVSNELGGERVDIVLWDENPAQYVINALAPAEVSSIIMDDDAKSMDVIVSEAQLPAAIGRNGQNVRLASQLTGWELNIMTDAQAQAKEQDEMATLLAMFSTNLEIEEELAMSLVEAGLNSIEEIAYLPVDELLEELEGVTEEQLTVLREKAQSSLKSQASKGSRSSNKEPTAELLNMEGLERHIAYRLANHNILTLDDLAECSVDDLLEIEGIDRDKASKYIMAARAPWFEANQPK